MSISLMLAVEDAPAAAEWYIAALGASELWSLGSVIGLDIGGAPYFLHEPTDEGFTSPAVIGQTTVERDFSQKVWAMTRPERLALVDHDDPALPVVAQ